MRMLVPIAAGLAVLTACTIDEDNFSERYSSTWCNRVYECNRGSFEDAYADLAECRASREEVYDEVLDGAEALGCSIDPEGAGDTLDEMRSASCAEFNDSLWLTVGSDVWDC